MERKEVIVVILVLMECYNRLNYYEKIDDVVVILVLMECYYRQVTRFGQHFMQVLCTSG